MPLTRVWSRCLPTGAMFWGLFYNSSSGNTTALTAGPAQALAPGLGLPTALPALHLLHTRFGRLPWSHLLAKATMLAQKGFEVDAPLASALAARGTKGLCPLFCHTNGTPLGLGAQATNPNLAAVLHREALASSPDLAGDALLSLLVRDLGLKEPPAQPMPSLEPALQLSIPQGVLFTTPGPSAGPELLELLESALHSRTPSPTSCLSLLQTAMACTLLNHLAAPQIQQQSQHQAQQRPTESPGGCGQGNLLQVVVHAEHAHVSSVPSGCCPFHGY